MPIQFDKARWNKIQKVLDEVFELPAIEQLDALRALCGGDTELFDDAQQMLKHEDQALTFLERPAADLIDHAEELTVGQPITSGAEVGAYRLCEKIGHGGMGVVYRAERHLGDFDQQVAIKFLLNWHASKSQRERFSHEQKLLAKLEHPNIARLVDGGITESNQPYLVMEYVSGTPIQDYCDQHTLDVNERLQLVMQICDALAYAHGHLIVHRDIKPSNLLVTPDAQIKLLDFGVAKLLDDDNELNLTRTGDQVLTPGFASPEQLQGQTISVATDVYQLGLLLYELLAGKQAHQDKASDFAAMIKLVCGHEPTLPSQLVASYDSPDNIEISTKRGLEHKALIRKLRGEIDSIVMKMLAIEPSQRYASMALFQADIDAYFQHKPISALPHNLFYQSRKMVRRHWQVLAASSAFVALLVAYAVTTSIQAGKIEKALGRSVVEQRKAQSVADFMINIFKAADPNVAGLETLTAQELLESGERKLSHDIGLDPAIHGHMLTSLGEIYYSQGNAAKSLELLQTALVKQRTTDGNELALANTLTQLAIVHSTTRNYTQAARYFNESEALYRNVSTPQRLDKDSQYAEMLNAYGILHLKQGDLISAKHYLATAIDILRRVSHHPDTELAVALNNMAHFQTISGDLAAAQKSMREAIDIHEKTLGEQHSYFSVYLNNFGNLLMKLESFDEAEPIFSRALQLQKDVLGNQHPYLVNTLRNMSTLAYQQGQLNSAEHALRQALGVQAQLPLADRLMTTLLHQQLGQVLSSNGRFDEASQEFEKMQALFNQLGAAEHLNGHGLCALAQHQYFSGDLIASQTSYENALLKLSKTSLQQSVALLGLAQVRLAQNEASHAKSLAQAALEIRAARLKQNHSQLIEAKAVLVLIEAKQGLINPATLKEVKQLLNQLSAFPRYYYGGRQAIGRQVEELLSQAH